MINLVVYDSLYGNTQRVAEVIAQTINGKAINVADFKSEMLSGISSLIVGSPIHGWRPSKPMQDFLNSLPPKSLKGVNVAAFDTRIKIFFSGSASDKIAKKLVSLGGKLILPPEKFYVNGKEGPLAEGEPERAKTWAKEIGKRYV